MKKLILSAILAFCSLGMKAQTSAEAIIGMCPNMPSDNAIATYIVKGESEAVQKYFQQLGEANRKVSKAATTEFNNRDFAKEQANMQKKQKQIMNTQAKRMEAGQRMMKFMASLTPEQQKKMQSFRKEADAMQYLASIGKLDELRNLMEGAEGAMGDETPVNQADMELARRDLSAEWAAAYAPVSKLLSKLSDLDEGLDEKASEAESNSIKAHSDGPGMGGAWDQEAVDNDMIGFWTSHVAARKKVLLDLMQAVRNTIPVAKMKDKQQNAMRRMTGQSPLTALESAEMAQAMEYLNAATKIFPASKRSDEIPDMMQDKTQEINYND